MGGKLMVARPVREGVMQCDGEEKLIWLEYLWNTGEVTRTWLAPNAEDCASNVRERDIANQKDEQRSA